MHKLMLAMAGMLFVLPAHASLNPALSPVLRPTQAISLLECLNVTTSVDRLIESIRDDITAKVSDNAFLNSRIVSTSRIDDFPQILAQAGYLMDANEVRLQLRQALAYRDSYCRARR